VAIAGYHGKTAIIANQLRDAMIRREYRPGDQLPTRAQLAQRYGVSNLTVQRALDQLAGDGFVIARGRLGTFVADQPPHLSHYALLFPTPREERQQNLFSVTLARCAAEMGGESARFTLFWGFAGRDGFEGYDRLVEDVTASRVAGLIFATAPYPLQATPLLTLPGVPRTAFMSNSRSGMPVVTMDSDGFLTRAAKRLRQMGRRRVAVLVIAQRDERYVGQVRRIMAQHGLECPAHWVQAAPLERPQWAGPLAQLLCSLPAGARPDALIITDQNHVAAAVAGLRECGCSPPGDVTVIAHCNLPLQMDEDLPVIWLGYDVAEGLRQCVRNIDDQRGGRRPTTVTMLKAVFADEASPGGGPGRRSGANSQGADS
jgi:DNA-binding transcriptional regulator YhcF (GntR family)